MINAMQDIIAQVDQNPRPLKMLPEIFVPKAIIVLKDLLLLTHVLQDRIVIWLEQLI